MSASRSGASRSLVLSKHRRFSSGPSAKRATRPYAAMPAAQPAFPRILLACASVHFLALRRSSASSWVSAM
eukprot:5044680-Lingulodinium_polyedra.AAC.1